MLLSMGMILNRLENLSIHSLVKDDEDPAELMSARMAYAPNCVQVSALGNGILCQSSSKNRFIIEDIGLQEGFEIIQGIFDFYNKWEAEVLRLAAQKSFQVLVDRCHSIFHNPVAIYDANYQVVALSSYYGEDDVDPEWNYIKRIGYSSVDTIKVMKYASQGIKVGLYNEPHLIPASAGYYLRMAGIKLYANNDLCGRMVIHEKDRPINHADLQVMTHLQGIIAPNLMQSDSHLALGQCRDVFSEIIITGKVDKNLLDRNITYLSWTDVREFRLVLIKTDQENKDEDIYHQLRRTILRMFPFSTVSIIGEYLTVIFKADDLAANPAELLLTELKLRDKACIGVSLPVYDLTKLSYYFNQTTYAIECAIRDNPAAEHSVINAFNFMVRYIIQSTEKQGLIYACHPDVLRLNQLDVNTVSEYIPLLRCYLDNERNMSSTAKALYMHRNTLVYRLEKLNTLLTADLNQAYERNYLRLSIYVLDAVEEES